MDQATINTDIAAAHEVIARLRAEVGRAVIGQEAIVDRLVIALLIRGHVLLEGVPGLAKTLLVKSLAGAVDATFHRIQFTPDLLPADITGTLIFDPANRTFTPRFGPIFANLVLADEINRAPPGGVQAPLARAADLLRRLAARHARAGARSQGLRLHPGARVRRPRGREGHRARRPAAPRRAQLRGGGGERDCRRGDRAGAG